ncbi:acyl-CoA/acyl-ACP dehydrogenase [Streptomyces spinoverrucosus]|uniref:acyl-CoA dehydrogenase family protein n=1 Tax=Streptomyces spinoverrucosus TaxID=284043 RepID=UPI0018C37297|nr:acyl-CoA/acyl-ACP dehydrogenase [Streptomyces spinoverrucosus]
MTVDLFPGPVVAKLADPGARFIRETVLPVEDRHRRVVRAGFFAPHVAAEYGGHGLDMRGRTVVFEEAGYSLLGPPALNIAAPDGGDMRLLEAVATPEQQERHLRPLATGEIRSCFAMTEPAPGAGSDPAALTTRAERVPGGRRIDGRTGTTLAVDGGMSCHCPVTPEPCTSRTVPEAP